MMPSVAQCAVPATRSVSPSIRKLAGRLLGCTCIAALWLDSSVEELWANERYSYHSTQLEFGSPETAPAAQRERRPAHSKRRQKTRNQVRQNLGKAHQSPQKSQAKPARHRQPETKHATKVTRSKSVRHSGSKTSSRGKLRIAHRKSRKAAQHRRHPAKTAAKASKTAGHHRSPVSTRGVRSTRAATNRSARTKTGQHWRQHDKTPLNHAPNSSAEMVAVPMPVPRPTPPPQVDVTEAVNSDTGSTVASVPEAANAQRVEGWLDSAPGPEDEIWQTFQIPDRAAILERDRLGMLELPKEIQDQMPKSPSPAEEIIREARAYLIRTSTEQRELCVGNTMARQGVETAIGRLHPVMAVRIARAIEQARDEGISACVFSAFRPPAFGVGGFSDKFNSAHAYGIAVDFGGIGRPGSKTSRRFQEIAASNGLYSLYGPSDRAEWNHYQLIPVRRITTNNPLRDTITATGPKDEIAMWTKSGVPLEKVEHVALRTESAIISVRTKVSHHRSHHRQPTKSIKVAPLSPFVRVQQTTATKIVPLSPFERVM
jgi:hypothetical protein